MFFFLKFTMHQKSKTHFWPPQGPSRLAKGYPLISFPCRRLGLNFGVCHSFYYKLSIRRGDRKLSHN